MFRLRGNSSKRWRPEDDRQLLALLKAEAYLASDRRHSQAHRSAPYDTEHGSSDPVSSRRRTKK